MRTSRGLPIACLLVVCSLPVVAGEPGDRAKKLLESANYTVTWGTVATFDPKSELEIGDGSGHGGTLGWLRFRPGDDGVDVLSIQFDEGWHPYRSKWPPDLAPVAVKCARLESKAYVALLHELAVVSSAKLKKVSGDSFSCICDQGFLGKDCSERGK